MKTCFRFGCMWVDWKSYRSRRRFRRCARCGALQELCNGRWRRVFEEEEIGDL